MATYQIPHLNAGSDIVDPVITVRRKLRGLDPDAMTVNVTVDFAVTDGNGNTTTVGVLLDNVSVPTLSYNEASLHTIVMAVVDAEYLLP